MSVSTIAVIGGTGALGRGLGFRFSAAGHPVVLGSRSADRAATAAAELAGRLTDPAAGVVSGAENAKAAEAADVVVLAVPYAGHAELVSGLAGPLAGKVVISCVNPLGFDKLGPFGLAVPEGSAAEHAAALLPDSQVVAAFHHVSAVTLLGDGAGLADQDVLVCGDDPDARATVVELAAAVTGRAGIEVGPLRLARQLEPLTAVLISINKRYKAHSGVRISGLPHGTDRH
ncbi:MAG TPA: NADPH-dependent F420 reductase [Actinomycetes bacterium]|nr:NADPH-dependent F420 reductase [Actinomycetes bacterium]